MYTRDDPPCRNNNKNKWIKNELTKYVWCECKCTFDGTKCNWNEIRITIDVDVSVKNQENIICAKKIFGIPVDVFMKMVNI